MRDHFSEREQQSLTGRIFRSVSRLLQNVECLEVLPHRVRRIREPAMRECVRREEVAELVVHLRQRHADDRRHRRDDSKCGESHDKDRQPTPLRERGECVFNSPHTTQPAMWREECQREEQHDADSIKQDLRPAAAEPGCEREILERHHAPLNETGRAVMWKKCAAASGALASPPATTPSAKRQIRRRARG